MAKKSGDFEYDVAVSFAGENRAIAEQFAKLLAAEGFSVFYDNWNKAELWGKDLYTHLDEVYAKKARFCVMFLSEAYAKKAWTNHERQSAQSRAFQENEAYILPVRLDDTVIPGIRPTVGYLDLRQHTIEEVAALASEKITAAKSRGTGDGAGTKAAVAAAGTKQPAAARSANVQLKKKFTEHDRDTFLEEAYDFIGKFFEQSLAALQAENDGIKAKFRRIDNNHFTAMIYSDGSKVAECGIRLGGTFGNQISFSYDANATNSMNEAVRVEDDGKTLFLKANGFSSILGGSGKKKDRLTAEDAAELFWAMLIERLR